MYHYRKIVKKIIKNNYYSLTICITKLYKIIYIYSLSCIRYTYILIYLTKRKKQNIKKITNFVFINKPKKIEYLFY